MKYITTGINTINLPLITDITSSITTAATGINGIFNYVTTISGFSSPQSVDNDLPGPGPYLSYLLE